jgi:hypothetical protein
MKFQDFDRLVGGESYAEIAARLDLKDISPRGALAKISVSISALYLVYFIWVMFQ